MGWLVAAGALLLALGVLALLPLRVFLVLSQDNLQATVRVEVRFLLLRRRREITVPDLASGVLERVLRRADRRQGAGDREQMAGTSGPGLRYLVRAARCSRLHLRLEVGGLDACDSALMAGLGWSAVHIALAQLDRWLRLERDGVAVAVVPNFQRPLLRTDLDCILSVRLWQAIAAVAMMHRQATREGAALARPRDGRRRKGEGIRG